jgi:hypothetical protein
MEEGKNKARHFFPFFNFDTSSNESTLGKHGRRDDTEHYSI